MKKYYLAIGLAVTLVVIGGLLVWLLLPKTTAEEKAPQATTYTLAEVATHAGEQSCWSAIDGVVYDLTTLVQTHTGGSKTILAVCGKDGTQAFSNQHAGDPVPTAVLAPMKIGTLAK